MKKVIVIAIAMLFSTAAYSIENDGVGGSSKIENDGVGDMIDGIVCYFFQLRCDSERIENDGVGQKVEEDGVGGSSKIENDGVGGK